MKTRFFLFMSMHDTDYPERTPRRYVLSYRVPEKDMVIMFDPTTFYFGHFRRLTKKQRQAALRTWQDYWKQGNLFPRLFDVPFEQKTYTRERNGDGHYKRDTFDLLHATQRDVEHALQCEIRARQSRRFKAAHLWNGDGDKELFDLDSLSIRPFQGSTVTTAKVRSDSSARAGNDVLKYRSVSIDDLFGKEGHFITGAQSTTEDFHWSGTKEGRTNVIVIDKDISALMDLAKHNPQAFREYNPRRGTAFLPFDMTATNKHEGVRTDPKYTPGTNPPRDVLMIDILMYWLYYRANGATQFQVSKNLMQMPVLMDPTVITAIRAERLRFEVLTQAQAIPKDLSPEKICELRRLYSEMNNDLTRRGYALEGHTLEFKGTNWETVAFNYVGVHGSARVLFHTDYSCPPLVMYKANDSPRGTVVTQNEHPIRSLAKRLVTVDDWTRRNRTTEVEVPDVYIDGTLISDYKTPIAEHYDGGIEGFRGQVVHRYMCGTAQEKKMGAKLLALVK